MSCSSSSGSEEDDEGFESYRKGGYHAVRVADHFSGGRYIAQRKLGWGQFSTVWLAYDTTTSSYVALKIQKSATEFVQAALHEIDVLSSIADGDPSNSKFVVQLIDHFKHTGPNGQHQCMVLEFLGDSLLRLIRYNHYKGLPLNKVREICKYILIGLDYLHSDLGIIHTDLKPENILLLSTIDQSKDPFRSGGSPILERPEGNTNGGITSLIEKRLKRRARSAVAKISGRTSSIEGRGEAAKSSRNINGIDMRCKIVDFGNACWADKKFAEEIQTRQYRAPEVILKSGYSFSVDMWSFASIVFELATGDMLFTPKGGQGFSEDEDHLALMMELLGKMPRKIATSGAMSKDYFDRHGDLKRIRRLKYLPLDKLLIDRYKFSANDAHDFSEFLLPLFDFAPEKRPTARQCLQHPWLNCKESTTPNEMINESTVEKVNVGMSNLKIKVLPEIGYQLLHSYSEQIKDWGWICNIHTQNSETFRRNLDVLNRQQMTITLVAVPYILGVNLNDVDLLEFLQQLADTDGSSTMPPSVVRLLNSKACRGAIMFGDSLLPSECSLLVEELKHTSLCFQCAHGRPTTVPLVNLEALHNQIAKLGLMNESLSNKWHGLQRHKVSIERAAQRLSSATRS